MSTALDPKRHKAAAVSSWLGIAVGLLAIAVSFSPTLGERLGVPMSFVGILCGFLGLGTGYKRNGPLAAPVIALLVCAAPASVKSWKESRAVWVESDQLCEDPSFVARDQVGVVADVIIAAVHRNAVGTDVCRQLGLRYAEYDCNARIGRLRCEP